MLAWGTEAGFRFPSSRAPSNEYMHLWQGLFAWLTTERQRNTLHRFLNLRSRRVQTYFIPRGEQQLVTNPILPLHPDFQWLGPFINASPISKGCSFQSSRYTTDQGWIAEKENQGEGAGRTWVRFLPFWRNESSLKKARFLETCSMW